MAGQPVTAQPQPYYNYPAPPPNYYPSAPSGASSAAAPQQQQQQQNNTTVVVANLGNAGGPGVAGRPPMVGGNRGKLGYSRHGQMQNTENWSTGMCGCAEDMRSCLCAWCCPHCFLCCLAKDMDEFCFGPCLFSCHSCHCHRILPAVHILPITLWPNMFLMSMRTRLRAQHGIRGSILRDFFAVLCCEFCTMTQMKRQMKHYRRFFA